MNSVISHSRLRHNWMQILFEEQVWYVSTGITLVLSQLSPAQFSSVAQSCPTLCDPMNRSTPGLPVHHQLPEFTQTHVHRVGDAIQPSHPLSSPSPPAPNPSQHQGLFQWASYRTLYKPWSLNIKVMLFAQSWWI